MLTFNLHEYMSRRAVEIPNGQSVSDVPNGSGAGQGVLVSDGDPGGPQRKTPLKEIISDILSADANGVDVEEIARIAKRAMSTDVPPEFSGNDEAMQLIIALSRKAFEDQTIPTTDPESGEPERGIVDLAVEIAEQAGWDPNELVAESKQRTEVGGTPMQPTPNMVIPQVAAAVRVAAEGGGDAVPESVRKKKKGNPFKVLMGRVQKLLDHGVDERGEVVRTILRGKENKWKRDTVEQAYDIVKERNVRKERKDQGQGGSDDSEKQAKSFNLARYEAMQRMAADQRFQGQPGETAEKDRGKRRPSLYDVERPTSSMSFWELVSRAQYLASATNADSILLNENLTKDRPQQGSSTRSQLREIRAELSKRGYDGPMLSKLFGIPPMRQDKTPQGQAIDKKKLDSVKPRQTV